MPRFILDEQRASWLVLDWEDRRTERRTAPAEYENWNLTNRPVSTPAILAVRFLSMSRTRHFPGKRSLRSPVRPCDGVPCREHLLAGYSVNPAYLTEAHRESF